MELNAIVLRHREYLRQSWRGLVPVIGLTLLLIFAPDVFVAPYGPWIVAAVALLCLAFTLLSAFKGLSEERLDAKGVTLKYPFGTKHYAWSQVEHYGIETFRTGQGLALRFRIHFREKGRSKRFMYREDIAQYLLTYRGQPAYDQRKNRK